MAYRKACELGTKVPYGVTSELQISEILRPNFRYPKYLVEISDLRNPSSEVQISEILEAPGFG